MKSNGNDSELASSSNVNKNWIPSCDLKFVPNVGQIFNSLEEAYNFYFEYGKHSGFDIRRSVQKTHKDGTILRKHFCCSRAGHIIKDHDLTESHRKTMKKMCDCKANIVLKFVGLNGYVVNSVKEVHNHELATSEGMQFMKSNRQSIDSYTGFIMKSSRVNIGPTKAYSLLKEMIGGYSSIGATVVDFKNINRDVKLYIGDNDAQMLIHKFKTKNELCEGFYYDYDVDSEQCLTKLFWADPISRRNFDVFGDVVSFDSTFSTNK